jgi:hypothetical protein
VVCVQENRHAGAGSHTGARWGPSFKTSAPSLRLKSGELPKNKKSGVR